VKRIPGPGSIKPYSFMKKLIARNRRTIVDIIAAFFIVLFFYTALSKSYYIDNTVEALKRTNVFVGFESFIAWAVVAIEYIIATLLFLPRTRRLGLKLSFVLMAVFSFYVGFMMFYLTKLPCSCGGIISKMTWKQHLIFNISMTLFAYWTMRLSKGEFVNVHQFSNTRSIIT
jgi:putative oxidoreductase